ncbi:hypothetical protein M3Y99_00960300 [Aphelenchoides fujianensis]|nr:hypothetical protein M3Y99_00960300 [Aphelenchoides fujianensis]
MFKPQKTLVVPRLEAGQNQSHPIPPQPNHPVGLAVLPQVGQVLDNTEKNGTGKTWLRFNKGHLNYTVDSFR